MTVKELKNEIYSYQDVMDLDVNALAKENNFPCISRMKKAELIAFLELLEEMQKESEVEEAVESEVESEEIQILKNKIQEVLQQMQHTLDNKDWTILHERYLDYKMKLRLLQKQLE